MPKNPSYSLASLKPGIPRRKTWVYVALAALVVAAGVLAIMLSLPARPVPDNNVHPPGFVTRSGDQLFLDGRPFRFSGPNIYWLGLAEVPNVHYPSEFAVNDALGTAREMGATVVRAHTLGFSTGCSLCIEPSLGTFNETALRHVDYAIKVARDNGIRLILPLTDNSHYYSGGKQDFTTWRGITDERQFYTDPQVIADFEQFISTMLNRVNTYTGVAYKDDPTILAWETGNELDAPATWVYTIARYLKYLDPNHLVLDGDWGRSQLTSDLPLPDVDIYSIHGYPMSIADLDKFAGETNQAGKAFLIGEYGWKNLTKFGEPVGDPLDAYLAAIEARPGVVGDLYWSLYPHSDTHGFVQHEDEHNVDAFTLHYPGDTPDLRARVQVLRTHAYEMRGVPVPPASTPGTPAITSIELENGSPAVVWRGAVGGDTYSIERSTSTSGPWSVVCDRCVTDYSPPWVDTASTPGAWYRVTAYNVDGVAGEPSAPLRFILPTPTPTPQAYTTTVAADHPASYWRLGESSGTVAQDSAGSVQGVYTGGVTLGQPGALVADKNTAASLDGTTGSVTFGDHYGFEGRGPFTLEVWVYPTTIDQQFRRILSKETYDGSTQPATRQGYDLAFTSPDQGGLYFSRALGSSVDDLYYDAGLKANAWNHVVATYDGTTMDLYLNGALVATKSSTVAIEHTPVNLTLGGRADGGDYMAGKVDEVAIYTSALSPEHVAEHYRAGLFDPSHR